MSAVTAPTISLLEITDSLDSAFILTPRSNRVCAREGIPVEELFYLTKIHFSGREVSDQICEIRWIHYENSRKEKIRFLQRAYRRISNQASPDISGLLDPEKSMFSEKSLQSKSAESSKLQLEMLAQRQKKNVSKMLFDEYYWQIMFEQNQSNTKSLGANESSTSVADSSYLSNSRKEQIMLNNHREAERARRAAEIRSLMEKKQEKRKVEVCLELRSIFRVFFCD